MFTLIIVSILLALSILVLLHRLFRAAAKRERREHRDPLDLRRIRVDPKPEEDRKENCDDET